MCRQTFYIIGIDDDRRWRPTEEVKDIIARGTVFSGGKRHHEIVGGMLPAGHRWIDITVPLDDAFRAYESCPLVVVFASGDPLFFGFANTVRHRLPEAAITVYPAFNSLQTLAHRMVLPYQDMRTVSLTGRPWHDFDAALIGGEALIGVLTDRTKTPAAIAAHMLEYGYDNYRMTVGEQLGNRELERVGTFSLPEAQVKEFRAPNCAILERTACRPRPFGIPEEEFHLLDGRTKMITKMPVRLLTLSLLDLRHRSTFWDIGCCTGSVSIEAKLQFPTLHVTAFEQREACREIVRLNSRKFGVPGIDWRTGDFLAADLSDLTAPDAVFVGGHGGRLPDMLRIVHERLAPGGVIVFNSVSAESLQQFRESAERLGRRVTQHVRIAVDTHNPIDILKAE